MLQQDAQALGEMKRLDQESQKRGRFTVELAW